MSDAFRALGAARLARWNWASTTLLFISHDWDPDRDGAEALAGRRLVKALLDAGAHVHVIAGRSADDELRHPHYDVTNVPRHAWPRARIARAHQMVRSTIPESEGTWVPGAIAAGIRALSSLPPDTLIYGRAMPGASNIAAWALARRTGLPWVAHLSDEWPPRGLLSNGRGWLTPYKWPLFQVWRHRIFRDAGALTFTNPLQGKDVLRHRQYHLSKAFVVTHLSSGRVTCHRPPPHDVFHIVHTGNIYAGRSSAALMQGLRLFLDRTPAAHGRVRFTQAGWDSGDLPRWTQRCGLDDVVRVVGRISEREVGALVGHASLLIVLDFALRRSTTMPSKIPDYMDAGRPILAITAASTALGRLFDEDRGGLTADFRSAEEIGSRIGVVFDAWRQGDLEPWLPKRPALESFTRARVLSELAGAFAMARGARRQRQRISRHRQQVQRKHVAV